MDKKQRIHLQNILSIGDSKSSEISNDPSESQKSKKVDMSRPITQKSEKKFTRMFSSEEG
jgi:hypothetical protein